MAIDRHDKRETLEEGEANAIGTEYLRADLLPPTASQATKELLKQYLDQRILFYSKQHLIFPLLISQILMVKNKLKSFLQMVTHS